VVGRPAIDPGTACGHSLNRAARASRPNGIAWSRSLYRGLLHGEKRQKKGIHMVEVGKSAPDLELSTDDGRKLKLKDLKGHPVVLYFYPKDDTPGCTTEAKDFTCLADQFKAAGATVIGISPDNADSHRKFREKYSLTHKLASDDGHKIAETFGVWVEKQNYGKTYMGVDRSTFLIDGKGKVAKSWRKVKVQGHAEEVLAEVKALRD
jgi:peroxiredoxin Q/BCP